MESKTARMDLAGREFKISNEVITTYANGSALISLGDTAIMANAMISEEADEKIDMFPMTVDYEENMYAAGKIKGSRFIKREGRPSENATLISRLIDRPIRPLFPKGTINKVQIVCTALSADLEVNPATTAINAASVALMLSGAPFEGPIGAVRIGYFEGKLIVNPTYTQCDDGLLNLVVVGTMDAITMVEASANEVTEDVMLEALELAHKHIKEICKFQLEYVKGMSVKKIEAILFNPSDEVVKKVKSLITDKDIDGVKGMTKMEVKAKVHELEEKVLEGFAAEIEKEEVSKMEVKDALNDLIEKRMRQNILEKEMRLDSRKLDEIRPIKIIPSPLARTHGSVIFQRGETTALTITTLGGPGDAQTVDIMDRDLTKRYMHHYHFPSYATGEIKASRGPSRREIGHGDLAERALLPVLPSKEEFPYTMWLVSEIIKCNGSSSMASVCGSSLSLMCAGVPIKKPVAGIAMGLITDSEKGTYKILTDIQGMEDFAGDMDFKITGTRDGITALQMDIKVKGLSTAIMKEALQRAKVAVNFILDKMNEIVPAPKKELSKYAPLIFNLQIDPEMIRVVIGKGGETIQGITKECGVEIDIEDTGIVTVTAPDQEKGKKALDWIHRITYIPNIGDVFDGKVVKVMEFGAFVEFLPGKEGLVHISQLAKERVNRVDDVVAEGDVIKVKLMEIDDHGRYNLSHKAVLGGSSTPKKE